MTPWRIIVLTTFSVAQVLGVVIKEILPRSGNTVQLRCEELSVTGQIEIITDPMNIYLNSSALVVTTLLEERDIDYYFDPVDKIFSFNIQQDLEGCYYCGNITVLSHNCITLVAYPVRDQTLPRCYEAPVGQPVRLLNGVREGALASHYDVWWTKGFSRLTETEGISYERGDDFSLAFTSVKISDSGTYTPTVKVTRGSDVHYVDPEISIELVAYSSPKINTQPTSRVAVQGSERFGSVSFSCVASGGPRLRVSWMQNMNRNLTSMPDPRYAITSVAANDLVTSHLLIKNATYLDSGSYYCVAYILDRVDEYSSGFVMVANATLTVLDAKFHLQTKVTQDKELQIWISLQVPLPDPVRAVVYFTSTEDEQLQRRYVTSSSQTNSTALFFLLHFPDIPEDVRDGSFKVQVALKVGVTEGPLVPSSLEEAATRNINEATEDNSEKCNIITIMIISAATLAVSIGLVTIIALASIFCCYKWGNNVGRRKYMQNMSGGHFDNVSGKIAEIQQNLEDLTTNDNVPEEQKKERKKVLEGNLTYWQGVLRGDGTELEDTTH